MPGFYNANNISDRLISDMVSVAAGEGVAFEHVDTQTLAATAYEIMSEDDMPPREQGPNDLVLPLDKAHVYALTGVLAVRYAQGK